MNLGAALRRLARLTGIIVIFSVVGPLAFAVLVLLSVLGLGAPLVELLLAFVKLDAVHAIVSVAVWLLAVAMVLASFLPSVVGGIIFAVAAVYAGINAFWMAWLAVAVAIAGVIVLGVFVVPDESSAVILPSARTADQALALFAMLMVLAIVPTTLCWRLAKPLSRAIVQA